MIKNFDELLELAKENGPKKMAVAMAADKEVLLSIKEAMELNIIDPILIGDKIEIEKIAKDISLDLKEIELIDEADNVKGCEIATRLVSEDRASILMKGFVDTPIIMRQVLNKEYGLRTNNIISHAAVIDVKTYHKLLVVTDAAMNIAPNLDQKVDIINNAVNLVKSLGIDIPKVGVVAANEKVSEKMIATVDAKNLSEMNKKGEISSCIVEGPFALDNAVSKEAAKHKNIVSDVAGDVDIILVPDIEAGNILYKSLTFLAQAKSAGIILGAKAPIVLTSRADTKEAKLYSIALSALSLKL